MRLSLRRILLLQLFFIAGATCAQDDSLVFRRGEHYRFVLNNGEKVSGFVVQEDADWIVVEERPRLTRKDIRKSTIVNVDNASMKDLLDAEGFEENEFAGFYLAGSSALPFEPEQVTATAHWLLIDHTQYAFNKNWAFHATSLTFYPFSVGIRFVYEVGEMDHIGGNVSVFSDIPAMDGNTSVFGYFAQAKWTHGTPNRNITLSGGFLGLGGGFFYSSTGRQFGTTPVLSAGFCNRLFPSWCIVLEGHALPDEGVMAGGGGFKILRENSSWTLGCYGIMAQTAGLFQGVGPGRAIPLPYIGYTWNFD